MTLPGTGPFAQFNFVIDLGTAIAQAGFQEISGLSADLTARQVTLKRGVFRLKAFQDWLRVARSANYDHIVTIRMQSSDAPGVARRWRVINARPVKYTSAPLDGSGGADVAMEELVLGYDRLESA